MVKHGIIELTKYTAFFRVQKISDNNAIAPGFTFSIIKTSFLRKISKLIPMGRMAKKMNIMD